MISKTNANFFLKSAPLFLIIFIDGMGLSFIMPILVILILEPSTSLLPLHMSFNERNFIYGFILAIYFFCWFWGATIISDWSDQVGRKKALAVCLLGTFIGYALSILAVITHQLWLLIIGRIIDGFTTGSQPLAQAAIVDLSTKKNKARNIAYITSATSIGFILGPIVGSLFSDAKLVSWFSPVIPLYFMTILSLVNLIYLLLHFEETLHIKARVKVRWQHAVTIFADAFKNKKIRFLAGIYLIVQIGWAAFYSYILLYLYHRYHFSVNQNGEYFALVGIGFMLSSFFFIKPVVKILSEKNTCIISAILTAVFIYITLSSPNIIFIWVLALIIPATMIIFYATILSIFSNLVGSEHQGYIMGVAESVKAFAFSVSGLICSLMASVNPSWPIILSIVTIAIGGVLMFWHKN